MQEKDVIEFRHYGIRAVPAGVSRAYVVIVGCRLQLFEVIMFLVRGLVVLSSPALFIGCCALGWLMCKTAG